MIRAILVVGWLGMVMLVIAALTGYAIHGEETAQRHLVVALFPSAALLFADLCLLVYMPGTARLVRRLAGELHLGGDWAAVQARLARRGAGLAFAAAVATGALFGTGYPAYSGFWPAWIHHLLFYLAALLQLAFLVVGGRALVDGEARLRALGREVEERGPAAILPAPP